jgi:hypothetical protein
MKEQKKKVRTGKEVANIKVVGSSESAFRRAIGYTYRPIVSEPAQESTIKTASEKVDTTVTTFLTKGNTRSLLKEQLAILTRLTASCGFL